MLKQHPCRWQRGTAKTRENKLGIFGQLNVRKLPQKLHEKYWKMSSLNHLFINYPKNPQGPSNGRVFFNLYDAGVFLGPQNSQAFEGSGFLGYHLCFYELLWFVGLLQLHLSETCDFPQISTWFSTVKPDSQVSFHRSWAIQKVEGEQNSWELNKADPKKQLEIRVK